MKKLLSVLLAFLLVFCFCSCKSKTKIEEDSSYKYNGVKFVQTDELTFEAACALVPYTSSVSHPPEFNSLKDLPSLEKYIENNLESYSVMMLVEDKTVRIYLKPIAETITKNGDLFTFASSEETLKYFYIGNEELNYKLVAFDSENKVRDGFEVMKFEKGKLVFEIELVLGLSIQYIYK